MKNEFLHKLFGTLLWVAVGFIICLIFWRPWEQVIITSGPTAAEIVKHTVEPAKVIDTAIKQKAKEVTGQDGRAKSLEKQLATAQDKLKWFMARIDTTDERESGNGTAKEFTEVAAPSIDLCNQVIAVKDSIIANKDTLIEFATVKAKIFEHGFNEMSGLNKQQSEAIKQLNKKFKWQKIQATGLKVVAIAAAAMFIKNNVKF